MHTRNGRPGEAHRGRCLRQLMGDDIDLAVCFIAERTRDGIRYHF